MGPARFSTDALPAAHRTAQLLDEVGGRFTATDTAILHPQAGPPRLEMTLVPGASVSISRFYLGGVHVRRGHNRLRDGDDGFTFWISGGTPLRYEHNGHRAALQAGQAMLLTHRLPSERWWSGNQVALISLPRDAVSVAAPSDAICGAVQAANRPILKLLRAYLRSVWPAAVHAGGLHREAERNIIAMVAGVAAATPEGMRRAAWPALGPARLAAMREIVARRAAEPGLCMREVAAAVGLSERSGHSVFAAQGLRFSDVLNDARLEAVATRLRRGDPGRILDIALDAGFGDVAHFNRSFRRRYGVTPSDMRAGR